MAISFGSIGSFGVEPLGEKTATLHYTLETQFKGTFHGITVRVVPHAKHHLIAEQNPHNNLLRVLLVNEDLGHTLFDGSGTSLISHLPYPYTGLRYSTTPLTMPPDFYYLSEEYRKIILGGIDLMQFFHKSNVQMGRFGIHNIVIESNGNPKFFNMQYLEQKSCPLSEDEIMDDYDFMSQFIQGILPPGVSVPADVQHLLDLLSSKGNWKKYVRDFHRFESLLLNHVSLKTALEADYFYRKIGKSLKQMDSVHTLRYYLRNAVKACASLSPKLSQTGGWAIGIVPGSLFYGVYKFKNAVYRPNDPVYAEDDLLNFIRNSCEHLKDKGKYKWVKDEEITKWIDKYFPGVMAELQCYLADLNMLDVLMAV